MRLLCWETLPLGDGAKECLKVDLTVLPECHPGTGSGGGHRDQPPGKTMTMGAEGRYRSRWQGWRKRRPSVCRT